MAIEVLPMLKVDYIVNTVFNSMAYIISADSADSCWLIDCGDVDPIIKKVRDKHIDGVLLTHAHFDHIYGLNKLMEIWPDIPVFTNASGKDALMNPKWNFSHYHDSVNEFVCEKPQNVRTLEDGETTLSIMGQTVAVLQTPGHDTSCMAYRIGNYLFTGDAYIPGVKTPVSFPRSNKVQAADSLSRLLALEKSGYKVLPGHWCDNINSILS